MVRIYHLDNDQHVQNVVSQACSTLGYEHNSIRNVKDLETLLAENPLADLYLLANRVPDEYGKPLVENGENAIEKIRAVNAKASIVVYDGSHPPTELAQKPGVSVYELKWEVTTGFAEMFLRGCIKQSDS